MNNKAFAIALNTKYLAVGKILLGILLCRSGLSDLSSEYNEQGVNVIFILMIVLGLIFIGIGILLLFRRRLGLYLAIFAYTVIMLLITVPRLYALVASSQLEEIQLAALRFTWIDILGILLVSFLLYWVYSLLKSPQFSKPNNQVLDKDS